MTMSQPVLKTINREFKPARLVIGTVDNLTPNKKPFGNLQLFLVPERQSSILSELNGMGIQYSFAQFQSALSKQFGSSTTPKSPVITPGGSFAYFDLSDGNYLLRISAACYLEKQFTVSLPLQNGIPITGDEFSINKNGETVNVTITLLPSPAYVFASGMTLVRVFVGVVTGTDTLNRKIYRPISDARLTARPQATGAEPVYVGRTDEKGQAVLCCNRMTRDRIIQINGFTFDGNREFTLIARDARSGTEVETLVIVKEFWYTNIIIEVPQ